MSSLKCSDIIPEFPALLFQLVFFFLFSDARGSDEWGKATKENDGWGIESGSGGGFGQDQQESKRQGYGDDRGGRGDDGGRRFGWSANRKLSRVIPTMNSIPNRLAFHTRPS